MADLLGKDYTPPDVYGKVTGRAKYAEDFRMDGMLFCRLLKSPMPHCRVRGVDASAALAMDGVDEVVEIESGVAVVRLLHDLPRPVQGMDGLEETNVLEGGTYAFLATNLQQLPVSLASLAGHHSVLTFFVRIRQQYQWRERLDRLDRVQFFRVLVD